jgi:hypothetical protein
MADTPEKKVKRKVVERLKARDAYYFYPVTGGYGASGVPDIVACYRGVFLGIEVKFDMNKNPPTRLQEKHLHDIDEAGGIALVIDDNNVDYLDEVLNELDEEALRAESIEEIIESISESED